MNDAMVKRREMAKEFPRLSRVLFVIGIVLAVFAMGSLCVFLLHMGVWPYVVFFLGSWWLFYLVGQSAVDWAVLFGPDRSHGAVHNTIVVSPSPDLTETQISQVALDELAKRLGP
jgi:hypothetical protein